MSVIYFLMEKELLTSVDDMELSPSGHRGQRWRVQGPPCLVQGSWAGVWNSGTMGGVFRGQVEEVFLTQEE